ncbi:uncharacterized protein KQ657_002896 [Scheffersomyces spartinae]|uniref:Pre-mRNA-splicing factor CWC21 n=1 Tax=Scheffersomyces spartinae TaxID=45513 RepID=A0A9P7V5G3_9ASCO|nr:uncharacterized protein KQ657_002896 [Scheffersomyces spartinae]KAG7191627.1 hypothetical protein KQ657_002896 [Scheffersomyces spartinae]
MSYNGIGLQTPRGSGTSGHVETNLASRKSPKHSGSYQKRVADAKKKEMYERNLADRLARKDVSEDIQKHNIKREIEVKCMELREKLEDDDVDDQEIEKQIKALRESLKSQTNGRNPAGHGNESPSGTQKEENFSYGYKARYSNRSDRIQRD